MAATAWSIRSGAPKSRFRLLGTALVAVFQIAVMTIPLASSGIAVALMSLVSSSALIYLFYILPSSDSDNDNDGSDSDSDSDSDCKVSDSDVQSDLHLHSQTHAHRATTTASASTTSLTADHHLHLNHKHEQRATPETAAKQPRVQAVTIATALLFLVVCTIGLNGEQILDATASVKIRDVHFAGSRAPAVAKQTITLIAALMAIASTRFLTPSLSAKSLFTNPLSLIGAWAVAQAIRSFFLEAQLAGDDLTTTLLLMTLDKYADIMSNTMTQLCTYHKLVSLSLSLSLSRTLCVSGTTYTVTSWWKQIHWQSG
jgi:hypothetical protein